MFKKIDHVEIVTAELDRAVQFYTDVLGFKLRNRERIERSTMGMPLDLVYLDLGSTAIELIKYGGQVAPAPAQEHWATG
jgi:glyoxylase I family protein